MSPSPGGKPVPPRLLEQLALTLRALEGARRGADGPGDPVARAREDLGDLEALVEEVGPESLPEGISDELGAAREALDASEVDRAREVLVGVGRSIDDYLRS